MDHEKSDLLERLRCEELARLRHPSAAAAPEQQTIPYTDLPEDNSGPVAREWNVYRREVGRLLAEGRECQWVLIKGDEIIGCWDSQEEAYEVAIQRYSLQPVLIRQILRREPVVRGPSLFRPCRS